MKPASFRYLIAESVQEALALKAEHGDAAKFLAGGQSLVPAMNFRLAQPSILIDLNPIAALGYIRSDAAEVQIGALTRYYSLLASDVIVRALPLMREALPHVAHPQIRNRGTLGGNLAHADPASEMPACLLALDGRVLARSMRGERWIAATEFFTGTLSTALAEDELLSEIALPIPGGNTGSAFMEVARRQGDFALCGVAVVLARDAQGRCNHSRLAFCGAGATPVLATDAAQLMLGQPIEAALVEAVGAAVARELAPLGSVHASIAFQRHLASVLVRRAIRVAWERASVETTA